jgi:Ser/Thr protein kinase RdoA (MazF antagonist)
MAFDSKIHWQPEILKRLGAIIGEMHVATQEYSPRDDISKRHSWQTWVASLRPQLPAGDQHILDAFEKMQAWHAALPRSPSTYGLVHYDVHFGNFFVGQGGDLTLFDFDDACYNHFAADLMIPIYYAERAESEESKQVPARELLIEGYLSRNSMDQSWLDEIDELCFLRDLTLYTWGSQMFDYDNLPEKHRPFFEKRRLRILERL